MGHTKNQTCWDTIRYTIFMRFDPTLPEAGGPCQLSWPCSQEPWMITDLSHPRGRSVNDGVDPDLCSLSYSSIEDIIQKGCALLVKIDIESAYHLIPAHPPSRPWNGRGVSTYVDPMLPFSFRSANKIFNAVADTLN